MSSPHSLPGSICPVCASVNTARSRAHAARDRAENLGLETYCCKSCWHTWQTAPDTDEPDDWGRQPLDVCTLAPHSKAHLALLAARQKAHESLFHRDELPVIVRGGRHLVGLAARMEQARRDEARRRRVLSQILGQVLALAQSSAFRARVSGTGPKRRKRRGPS